MIKHPQDRYERRILREKKAKKRVAKVNKTRTQETANGHDPEGNFGEQPEGFVNPILSPTGLHSMGSKG